MKEKPSADHPAGRESADASSSERLEAIDRAINTLVEWYSTPTLPLYDEAIAEARLLLETVQWLQKVRRLEEARQGKRRRQAVHGKDQEDA